MCNRLKELREEEELIQQDLAAYLNITQSTYSDYESGKLNIPILALKKLADFYNTSIDYLLDQTDEKTPYARKSGK